MSARRAVACALALVLLAAPAARAKRSVIITGRGWGHGIGMSQYGAYGRALAGRRAPGILEHYYRGAHVRRAPVARKVRVGLLQGHRSAGLASIARAGGVGRVVFKVGGSSRAVARGSAGDTWRVEPSPTGGLRLYKNGNRVKRSGRSVFGSPRRPLVLDARGRTLLHVEGKSVNYAYGKLKFGAHAPANCGLPYCLRLVLSLPMQKYVYGLGEVPSSWPQATLRAQAIAARTYAHRKILTYGQHLQPCDCALYDSPIDQAYIGDAKRTGSGPYWKDWKRAVDRTKNKVILHGGRPIQALYSSSSGGHTENNENVWGGTPVPYLRGVRDRADGVRANPNFRWRARMEWGRFAARLDAVFGVGKLLKFKLKKPFGVSGRVTVVKSAERGGVKIVGSRRTTRVDGWAIRSALDLRDTWFRVAIRWGVAKVLAPAYHRLDGAPGRAIGAAYDLGPPGAARGRAQDFRRGRLTWVASTGETHWQWGPLLALYKRLGAEDSELGLPASDVRVRNGYREALYANGSILWSASSGAHAVTGVFADAYRRAGGPLGPLGLPVAERVMEGDAARQRFTGGELEAATTGDVPAGTAEARIRQASDPRP